MIKIKQNEAAKRLLENQAKKIFLIESGTKESALIRGFLILGFVDNLELELYIKENTLISVILKTININFHYRDKFTLKKAGIYEYYKTIVLKHAITFEMHLTLKLESYD